MGIISAAIALFSPGGVGQRERLAGRPSTDEPEAKSTILVIDDDPAVLLTVRTLLARRGFKVLTSSSSPKGVDLLHYTARDIRIVVLDYSMPTLDGRETLQLIKEHSPNARIIGLTALKYETLPREYIDGIDKLLSKPVVATALIGAVDELLGDGRTVSAAIRP